MQNRMDPLHGAPLGIIVIVNLMIPTELAMLMILFLIIGSVSSVVETFISLKGDDYHDYRAAQ